MVDMKICKRCAKSPKAGRSPYCIECKKLNRAEAVARFQRSKVAILECRHCGLSQDDLSADIVEEQLKFTIGYSDSAGETLEDLIRSGLDDRQINAKVILIREELSYEQ